MIYQSSYLSQEGGTWKIISSGAAPNIEFPSGTTESFAFQIFETIQSAEKGAHAKGCADTKAPMLAAQEQRVGELMSHIRSLEYHNDMLAEKLEHLIGE